MPPAKIITRPLLDVANGPQEGHLRVGIDRVLDAIDLDLWHGILLARR
jgi:hypothetical protein